MRITVRAVIAALLVGLVGLAPGTPPAARAAVDTRSTAKVVIVVGAVHGSTDSYRARGQEIYDEAVKWSSNVIKVFSPNATWAKVKAAMQGANIVVYLGHGNGFPSPYRSAPWPYSQNGMGLNETAGNGDYNVKYYGEYYIGTEVDLAPNAVVLLTGLCYAAGNSESGHPEPTLDVAMQRADNYAAGFLRAGAEAVLVENAGGDVRGYIRDLITGHASLMELWLRHPAAHGNEFSFPSVRTPGARVFMDPWTPTSGFKRALTGNPAVRSEQVSGVVDGPTGGDPESLVAPGNAEVATGGADPYWDSALTDDAGSTWPAGTDVRVEELAYGPDPGDGSAPPLVAARVRADGSWWSAWVAPDRLVPRDSAGPHVKKVTGPQTISPDGDGADDTLNLQIRLSESAAWTVSLRTAEGDLLFSDSGTGTTATITWDGRIDGAPAPAGTYRWDLIADDGTGNPELEASGLVGVNAEVVRVAGPTRYDTAAAISASTFLPGVATVYITTGLDYPTGVAGAAAAGSRKSPMLLTAPDALPAATVAELQRLQPGRIIVLGPESEVSDAVKAALGAYTSGAVSRIGGADRYAVAANISRKTFKPGVPVVYVATGTNFPDALAASAAGAFRGGPVLLVDPALAAPPTVVADELTRLGPASIVVLGDANAISETLFASLDGFTTGSLTRQSGPTRFDTAAATSKATFGGDVDTVYIATGLNFPDALAAATMVRFAPGPVLLVWGDKVPAATAAEIFRLHPARVVVLGSAAAVDGWVEASVRAYASR